MHPSLYVSSAPSSVSTHELVRLLNLSFYTYQLMLCATAQSQAQSMCAQHCAEPPFVPCANRKGLKIKTPPAALMPQDGSKMESDVRPQRRCPGPPAPAHIPLCARRCCAP